MTVFTSARRTLSRQRLLLTLASTSALGLSNLPAWSDQNAPAADEYGYQELGVLPGGSSSNAYGVSADGSVVVGYSASTNGNRAFRWTQTDDTMSSLGVLTGGTSSFGRGVNADGSVVVGASYTSTGDRAFRWTQADNTMQDLGVLPGRTLSYARGVSADGSVVVGYSGGGGHGSSAFRWTEGNGGTMQNLGVLAGGSSSFANGVSADGSVVVGYSGSSNGYRAFRWTQTDGTMTSLGVLAGGSSSFANGVNKDGSVVVGQSGSSNGNRAFRWTKRDGMITVEDWLRNSGVIVTSDFTGSANAVSADGSVVVGATRTNTAFIARGDSGIIDIEEFASSLSGSPSARLGLDQANTVLNGLHGDPMRNRLEVGKQFMQVSTDSGYDKSDASNGGVVITDLTYAYGFEGGITARIAAGGLYTDQNLEAGGDFNQKGWFLSPEVTVPVTGALYATVGGYYGSSSLSIDRGYLNGGALDYSQGKTDVDSWAARVRFDWLDAFKLKDTSLTPYTSLTYAHSRMDAYTETGGGFPARFDASSDHATIWRAGIDGVTPLNDQFRVLTRGEVAYRFEDKTSGPSGTIIDLSDFNFGGQDTDRVWLRGGVGAEFDVAGGTATLMLNVSTQGNDPSLWVKSAWKVAF